MGHFGVFRGHSVFLFPFGIFIALVVCFFLFWFVVLRQIWQPCSEEELKEIYFFPFFFSDCVVNQRSALSRNCLGSVTRRTFLLFPWPTPAPLWQHLDITHSPFSKSKNPSNETGWIDAFGVSLHMYMYIHRYVHAIVFHCLLFKRVTWLCGYACSKTTAHQALLNWSLRLARERIIIAALRKRMKQK
jgi:hypothetical protein